MKALLNACPLTQVYPPPPPPHAVAGAIAAKLVESTGRISVEYRAGVPAGGVALADGSAEGSLSVLQALAALAPERIVSDTKEDQCSTWVRYYEKNGLANKTLDFATMIKVAADLDAFLRLNTFLGGVHLSMADILCWGTLRSVPAWNKCLKEGARQIGDEVQRWFNHLASMPAFVEALGELQTAAGRLREKKKDQASYDIDLIGAEHGKVVTRFPPEPSGYLHIGHAKAAMLNQYFAQAYGGKLIVRFDDTNPSKEKSEFEESILEDLHMLGIHGDRITYSSDYFDQLAEHCRELIRRGKAYADDTPKEVMNEQRFHGHPSKNRDLSSEESLAIFERMLAGEDAAQTWCIRAKISVDNPNKAMRDPVIFRCNLTPHHRTGARFKAYPTYDFACPLIDSLEGVTHALRTNEYHDRNDQYYWMVEALGMRKPQIWDYSRMNFVYTLLSKRKLNWFVNNGKVHGWDDPRFPTVRGILRRGLTKEALREYILMQGPSKNVLLLEWDKLWTLNKKHIDPIAPRYTALVKEGLVRVQLEGGPASPCTQSMARHKKNPDLGTKETAYSSTIFLEQVDAASLQMDEEITLMDWGNAIVTGIQREDGGAVVSLAMRLHLEGDFKKTSKKLTWLSPDPAPLLPVTLLDYDYLITKKKLEEDDPFEDFITPVSEFITPAIGDANLASIKKGDIIQLERKGFFICDQAWTSDAPMKLISIPDGRAKSTSSKAGNANC